MGPAQFLLHSPTKELPSHPPGPLSQSSVLPLSSELEAAQPPAHQTIDPFLLSLLSVRRPFCTHLSAVAATDTADLRAEFISSVTGPGAHPPWRPCLRQAFVGSGREKREGPASPDAPWGLWGPRSPSKWLPGSAGTNRSLAEALQAWPCHLCSEYNLAHVFHTVLESGDLQRLGNWHPKS